MITDAVLMHNVCGPVGTTAAAACQQRAEAAERGRKRSRGSATAAGASKEELTEDTWVGCNGTCARWFHLRCVSIAATGDDEWFCEDSDCTLLREDAEQDVLAD
mmetsp:Transcript_21431/g.46068  ORF Transcript_21431/g.46068 Transcript_21431/m.46068 type:complete len:104 (-) Transcript_21431:285-596(-)